MKRTDSLLVLLVLLVVVQANTPKPRPSTPYMSGEEVKIQCKTRDGEWGPGPVCADTDAPLSFKVCLVVVITVVGVGSLVL